jgi:hypothetical protein
MAFIMPTPLTPPARRVDSREKRARILAHR